MAGNAGVLKHASNVPSCTLGIEALFRQAGFPRDLFRMLLIDSSQVNAVLAHPLVKAATLTRLGHRRCAAWSARVGPWQRDSARSPPWRGWDRAHEIQDGTDLQRHIMDQ